MTRSRLDLTRAQILAFRRHVGALDERLPRGRRSLRRAAWAGVFSLGRMPDEGGALRVAEDLAARLHRLVRGARMAYGEAGRALGGHPNRLRYAAPTGTVLIRWDGARQAIVWTVPRPEVDPRDARLELARRYLHIFGPTTAEAFAQWAGIGPQRGVAAFDELRRWLTPVRTPVGDSWILTRSRRCAPPLGPQLPHGSSRAATPTSFSRDVIVNFWSPTPLAAARSGRLVSGRAASSSRARSSGHGDVRRGP